MVKMAMVERMEPRRVPSRRSTGTLRYMSRLAMKGAIVVDVMERGGGCLTQVRAYRL